ncbi:hypothetical protein MAR_005857 [Mya arenaria]|nr:hypothetical protein MAR_005857 [Mya arenaria]
MLTLNSS